MDYFLVACMFIVAGILVAYISAAVRLEIETRKALEQMPNHIKMLLEILQTDPWKEHLARNPIANPLGSPGQCVEVMKNLIRAKFDLPLVNTSVGDND